MNTRRGLIAMLTAAGLVACSAAPPDPLVGAWHGKVQFKSGAFAAIQDLEFMYVFNAGGTLTESSNYDGSPPVPPAYGVWHGVGPREYEAHYEYFSTKPPPFLEDLLKGGGWGPSGHGRLVERIAVAADGNSFTSTIRYDAFDKSGKTLESGTLAEGKSERIR